MKRETPPNPYQNLAQELNLSTQELYNQLEAAIDGLWRSREIRSLFGGNKPTPESFLLRLSWLAGEDES